MDLKGSRTEENLRAAFSGESEARNKYTYFAGVAKREGYEQIAAIFSETAENEKEHAKIWFKELEGIGDTAANLTAAAEGENWEWTSMYKEFAATAREEGFLRLATLFENVGQIEKDHEARYLTLLHNLQEDLVFKRGETTAWFCRNCGHVHSAKEAPDVCPVCNHPRAYFELRGKNY